METSARTIRQEKAIKRIWIGREEVKLSFVDDVILYIEVLKTSTKKLPDLILKLSSIAGYKVNTQRSVTFWYINK